MTWWPHTADRAVNEYGALQVPAELGALLAILEAEQAVTVIEIGAWAGGLTWALMQLPDVRNVITVDKELRPGPHTEEVMGTKGVHWVCGDSTHRKTQEAVANLLPEDGADVLVIDGGHDAKTVRADWDNYFPLVASRGVVVLHDTAGYPGPAIVEVPEFWAKVRRDYRSLEIVATPGGPGGTGILWKG